MFVVPKYTVNTLPDEKKGPIYLPHLKASLQQEPPQPTILSSRHLLQPIQSLPQLVHPVGVLLTLKPRWLPHIHFFLQHTIQESTLHIHLVQFEPFRHKEGKKDPNRLKTGYRSKCLLIAYPLFLCLPVSNQPRLFSHYFMRTMCGSRTGGWSLPCVMSD
jgi:hypothetical protein